MTGKEKILQMLANDENLLAEMLDYALGCPADVNLQESCTDTCKECWRKSLKAEVSE
jgi:hypothetical protein